MEGLEGQGGGGGSRRRRSVKVEGLDGESRRRVKEEGKGGG